MPWPTTCTTWAYSVTDPYREAATPTRTPWREDAVDEYDPRSEFQIRQYEEAYAEFCQTWFLDPEDQRTATEFERWWEEGETEP